MSTMKNRRRKGSALLATTAVLGIGTVATLATWTVTEFVTGEFKTGEVDPAGAIAASADGTTYGVHSNAAGALALDWTGPSLSTLAGNDKVVAPYWLRTNAGTTANTTITLNTELTGGSVANDLTYSVYRVAAGTACTAGMTSASAGVDGIVAENVTVGANGTATFALAPGDGTNPGTAQKMCVKVNVGDNAAQDTETNMLFKFVAQQG